jgi:hypothetical protein
MSGKAVYSQDSGVEERYLGRLITSRRRFDSGPRNTIKKGPAGKGRTKELKPNSEIHYRAEAARISSASARCSSVRMDHIFFAVSES